MKKRAKSRKILPSPGRRTRKTPAQFSQPAKKKRQAPSRGVRRHLPSAAKLFALQEQLREAQETLQAIRSGEVDAVVISGAKGNKVYSLAGAEQPYRVYVEQMQEGAVTVSCDGLILFCNQRFSAMTGLPLERVISSSIQHYLSPDAWSALLAVFQQTEGVVKHEHTLQCDGQASVPVHLTASRLPLEGQDVMCLVVTDLSAQRERHQLQLAKELAEKASLAKDSFLAALSHELRTPLTPALMIAARLELDSSLPETTRRDLATIKRNVELEARLIDDLLDLTRIASGKLELQTGLVDLHHSLKGALEICQPDINGKQQSVHLKLEARRSQTMGDAVRLQQVLWNLVRNAAKFTPAGGSIAIETGNRAGKIWVTIADTGIGFEPGTEQRLFQAFEQGGRHITQQFGGLGLGLAISKSIMGAHGGGISGSSPGAGQGATFTLELPVLAAAALLPKQAQKTASPLAPDAQLNILLVEDHRDTRANMEILLRSYQHRVRSASSASEALELANAGTFDLVISDLGLPDQSGLEMMRILRDRFQLKGIAVSGYGMEEDILQSRDAGFVHHLTKPIAFDRLKRLIAEMAQDGASPKQ